MMDRDSITRTGARAPGVEQQDCSNGGAQAHNCPDTERGYTGLKAGGAKEGCKPDGRDNWAPLAGKAPFDKPTLKPYWGKLTVRKCVQEKLVCSVGDKPTKAKVRTL